MSSHISVEGSLYVQDTENGKTSNNIPFEIYSDYSVDDPATYFRQLHLSNVYSGSTFLGISNVGTYFYMSAPSTDPMTEQSNTFIMTSDGNVGIGKTDPSDRLHVEGNALVRGSLANVASVSVSSSIHVSNVMIDDRKLVVDGNANHRIPSGTIALWEDSTESTIPDGWTLFSAIGTRFVRGSTDIGSTSGNDSLTLENADFPKHNHNTDSVKYANGDHNHNFGITIGASNANHTHNIDVNINNAAYSHNHFLLNPTGTEYMWNYTGFFRNDQNYYQNNANLNRQVNDHYHRHNFKGYGHAFGDVAPNHTHTINTTFSNNAWSHPGSETTSTNNAPNSNEYSIIPPYKSYVFIIKL